MYFNAMAIVLTRKCNANCDICCFSCSPENNEKMEITDALNFIRQAAEIKSIRIVGVSGGEPFLFYDDLLKIAKECKKNYLQCACTTNGFWADNEEVTLAKLKELKEAGMSFITLSVDGFHEKYVSLKKIKNILNCAEQIQLNLMINCVVTKNSKKLHHISKALGDSLMGVRIIEYPCLPVGNALERIGAENFITKKGFPSIQCNNLTVLSIMPDGKSYPCPSEAGITQAKYLGNAKELTIKQINENFNKNKYCIILHNHGIKWFYDAIKEHHIPIQLKENYVSICDACYTICNNREYLDYFDRILKNYNFD